MKPVARYAIYFGMSGCYMPDSHYGAVECASRRELADTIRSAISMYDLPKSLFREVKIRRLWSFIKRNGSSSAHFHLHHKGMALSFSGLTEDEYQQQSEAV